MMRLMEWWCILLTAKRGNSLTMCILTFQLNPGMCVLGCVQTDSTHLGHLLLFILVGLYCWGDLNIYFEPHLRTRINRVPRHDDGGEVSSSGNLSIFSNTGRPTPKNVVRGRYLSEIEFKQAHNYVLFNRDELRPFIQ